MLLPVLSIRYSIINLNWKGSSNLRCTNAKKYTNLPQCLAEYPEEMLQGHCRKLTIFRMKNGFTSKGRNVQVLSIYVTITIHCSLVANYKQYIPDTRILLIHLNCTLTFKAKLCCSWIISLLNIIMCIINI